MPAKRTTLTDERIEKFLQVVANNGGIIADACKDLNISRTAVYMRKHRDAEFAVAMEKAQDDGIDLLEDEAKRRALDGTEEIIYYQGAECGRKRVKSDTMMALLLKGHRKRYRDKHEISGPDGAPLSSKVHVFLPDNGRPVRDVKKGSKKK
jgi:hypothetical protein